MWTPGRVAAALATANGDPNKILHLLSYKMTAKNVAKGMRLKTSIKTGMEYLPQ
jgi:hypothetical protein